eukprot:9414121-Heterocapsa_arctica.AAC.1
MNGKIADIALISVPHFSFRLSRSVRTKPAMVCANRSAAPNEELLPTGVTSRIVCAGVRAAAIRAATARTAASESVR